MGSLRDKILNTNDIRTEIIDIPEWGVQVEIKSLTGKQRSLVLSEAIGEKGKMDFEKMYPTLVIASTFDPITHEPVFQATDIAILNEKNGGALEKIAQKAMELSGLKEDSVGKAEKNL